MDIPDINPTVSVILYKKCCESVNKNAIITMH